VKKQAKFIIDNTRYETEYNSDNLRLGNLVYVIFAQNEKPESFHPTLTKNSIPYCIQWIAPSEWAVWLVNKIEITSDLKKNPLKHVVNIWEMKRLRTPCPIWQKTFL